MNTNTAALKLCPFCGAHPIHETLGSGARLNVKIRCPQCRQASVESDWYGGDLGTTEASWNKRVLDEAMDQSHRWLVEALEIIESGLRLYRSTPGVLTLRAPEWIEIAEEALDFAQKRGKAATPNPADGGGA